jgi:hypothetical protein
MVLNILQSALDNGICSMEILRESYAHYNFYTYSYFPVIIYFIFVLILIV